MKLALEDQLVGKVAQGRKLFVPYLTAALPDESAWLDLVSQISVSADAIEVGIPFSDPIMDGPVIEEASTRALAAGVTVRRCFELIAKASADVDCPLLVMTYFNPVSKWGIERFVDEAASSGVTGMIVPDLPFEESSDLGHACTGRGVALVQMVAPATSRERARHIAAASRGFVYAISRMGVTGEQLELAEAASEVMSRIGRVSVPVLLGIGISNASGARAGAEIADGVIVGSALMKKVLDGDARGAVTLCNEIRAAL